jgi:hypothetical protein
MGIMKITKRQLARIIKEERQKLLKTNALKESVTDMRHYEEAIDAATFDIAEQFKEDMSSLYDANDGFAQSGMEWEREVDAAAQALDQRMTQAIAEVIRAVEAELHDGQFSRK